MYQKSLTMMYKKKLKKSRNPNLKTIQSESINLEKYSFPKILHQKQQLIKCLSEQKTASALLFQESMELEKQLLSKFYQEKLNRLQELLQLKVQISILKSTRLDLTLGIVLNLMLFYHYSLLESILISMLGLKESQNLIKMEKN